MATIDIFPLAVNGVSPPLNLLYKLFTNPLDVKNLLYPLDLAANPNYGHAINFEIMETKYNIQNIAGPILNGQQELTGASANQFLLANNYKIIKSDNIKSNISLYMPDTLQTNYSNDWQQISLTEAMGLGSYITSAIADFPGRDASKDKKSNFWNPWGAGILQGGVSLLAPGVGGKPELGGVVGNALKTVPNPQLQMYYKGIGLREFQFDFKFTPVSKKEAQAVENIIKTFTYYSVPKLLGARSNQFLEPPQVFNITFAFTGGNSLSNAVTNFFKNIGTNIFTSQLTSALFGSAPSVFKSNNAKIFKIYHPCVLEDITVDYAPNGWASFDDGYPVETTMSLKFKETDIVTKDQVWPEQYKIDYPGSLLEQPNTNQSTPTTQPSGGG